MEERIIPGTPELRPMDQGGQPEASLPGDEIRHDDAVAPCAAAVASVGLVERQLDHADDPAAGAIDSGSSEDDDYVLPKDPTPADLLFYARRNLRRRGLPVSGGRGKEDNGYSAVDSPLRSVDGLAWGGGTDAISTHGTPGPR